MNKVQIITDKECQGKDEMWCNWYRCPNCEKTNIFPAGNYCPDCGTENEWQLEEQK